MMRALVLFACVASVISCLDRAATIPTGVVIITLDTTRADRLPAYGLADAEMPHLDRLAREGVVFEQANTASPLTLPAHASLFTGLLPASHGVRENAAQPLPFEHTTLAEISTTQGFRSAAFVGSAVLDPERGLSQGFEHYGRVTDGGGRTRRAAQRNAATVVDEAIRWLNGIGGDRFFLWTHLYDPHRPYEPPEPFATRYAHDPYIGEIAYADFHIGRLLEALERQQLLDRAIVIVAADHGESLGEHGERDHGVFVYESVLRIPLIIRAPAIRPRRVESVVRLIDVMPTVIDLLGLPISKVDGISLRGVMNGKPQDLDAYAESIYPRRFGWSPVRSLRDGRFKLIDAPRPELYDLERDPSEEHNLYTERAATAAALGRRLAAFTDGEVWSELQDSRVELAPPDVRERLAALGYVSPGPIGGPPERRALRDAKDFVVQNWSPQADTRKTP